VRVEVAVFDDFQPSLQLQCFLRRDDLPIFTVEGKLPIGGGSILISV
jgi:hypothetical protein